MQPQVMHPAYTPGLCRLATSRPPFHHPGPLQRCSCHRSPSFAPLHVLKFISPQTACDCPTTPAPLYVVHSRTFYQPCPCCGYCKQTPPHPHHSMWYTEFTIHIDEKWVPFPFSGAHQRSITTESVALYIITYIPVWQIIRIQCTEIKMSHLMLKQSHTPNCGCLLSPS